MATFQQIFALARPTLNDDDEDRAGDDKLMVYANLFLMSARNFRPDWFVANNGALITLPALGYALDEDFPLHIEAQAAMVDYIIARAHAVDDEFGEDNKVLAFFQSSTAQVKR